MCVQLSLQEGRWRPKYQIVDIDLRGWFVVLQVTLLDLSAWALVLSAVLGARLAGASAAVGHTLMTSQSCCDYSRPSTTATNSSDSLRLGLRSRISIRRHWPPYPLNYLQNSSTRSRTDTSRLPHPYSIPTIPPTQARQKRCTGMLCVFSMGAVCLCCCGEKESSSFSLRTAIYKGKLWRSASRANIKRRCSVLHSAAIASVLRVL